MSNIQEASTSFLGTGWSFPPRFSKASADVIMTSDVDDIVESLSILLSTSLGERIMQPGYGCDLTGLLFDPIDEALLNHMRSLVADSILYHEPRVKLNKVTIDSSSVLEGLLRISVDFTVLATNSRYNYVYPFYLNEGSSISK